MSNIVRAGRNVQFDQTMLFELAAYDAMNGDAALSYNDEDLAEAPTASAGRVYFGIPPDAEEGDETERYYVNESEDAFTLYFPEAIRAWGDNGWYYVGLPRLHSGLMVRAVRNMQSRRWEIIYPLHGSQYKVELTEDLDGSEAEALIYDERTVTVYDYFLRTAGDTIESGTPIYVTFFADENKLYVTEAPC